MGDDGCDSPFHASESLGNGVNVVAWGGNLIQRYVEGEIGICVHRHAVRPSLKFESGDVCFVFQNELRRDLYVSESDAFSRLLN